MDIRAARAGDADAIRRIAEQSFQTSYSLSPDQIETIVRGVFTDEQFTEWLANDAERVFVATDGDHVVGFADVTFGDGALLRWLHVRPGYRGIGVGTTLFEHVRTTADDRALPLSARVLVEDDEGEQFCEQFGFERAGKTKLRFDEESFFGYLYTGPGAEAVGDATVAVPDTLTVGGSERAVDSDDATPGTDGPFFAVGGDGEDELYGYYCSNCGSTDVGSDSLGRLECGNCGNKHLADQWDAAYF